MKHYSFEGTIVIFGFGAVSQCTLPLILDRIGCNTHKIIVIDKELKDVPERYTACGIRFFKEEITPDTVYKILTKYLKSGDLLVDLAYDIDCTVLLSWCHDMGVMYINTSVELWNPYKDAATLSPQDRTLYPRHMALRALKNSWSEVGPTAIVEHGANPGLVSHFVKKGLLDIARASLQTAPDERIESLVAQHAYGALAHHLGVKTIHISERDTQISSVPRAVNEFVNTWSIEGFREEGIAPAEMGWGTHEKELPAYSYQHAYGPKNQICLAQMGIQTWARSIVPSGPIIGMIVRHGESFTISDHLTVWDDTKPVYRPTVHYVYCPTDATLNSLHEFKMRNLVMQDNKRIMRDEITTGADEVGVLIMGHRFKSWWTGSVLSIDQARAIVPQQNATTLQVASSVLAALMWMLKNPDRGLLVPDDVPHEEILAVATPYLGTVVSQALNWSPLDTRTDLFKGFAAPEAVDYDDPWQFKNFRVTSL